MNFVGCFVRLVLVFGGTVVMYETVVRSAVGVMDGFKVRVGLHLRSALLMDRLKDVGRLHGP